VAWLQTRITTSREILGFLSMPMDLRRKVHFSCVVAIKLEVNLQQDVLGGGNV
jgi:hypothetical protein